MSPRNANYLGASGTSTRKSGGSRALGLGDGSHDMYAPQYPGIGSGYTGKSKPSRRGNSSIENPVFQRALHRINRRIDSTAEGYHDHRGRGSRVGSTE